MKTKLPELLRIGTALAFLSLAGTQARADYLYHVSLLTTPLQNAPLNTNGPYSFLFQLTDGDGTANNSVQITNIAFGGGTAVGSPALSSGVSGSVGSGIILSDTGFSNTFQQEFTPGSSLSFDVASTMNFAGGTPDQFAFSVVDGIGTPSLSTDFGGAFLVQDIDGSATPTLTAFGGADAYGDLETSTSAPIPEPAFYQMSALMVLGGIGMWNMKRKRVLCDSHFVQERKI